MTAPDMLCAYCSKPQGLVSSAQKLVTSYMPFGRTRYATGCCIHALVMMMKKPEIHDPTKTKKADAQCFHGERRFSPKRNKPRNADSRKKEKTPSMASGWPITPPETRENCAQLVPNSNSIGMPVTTPK